MKKQTAYCLVPEGESFLAFKLKPRGGDYDFEVEWIEKLAPGSMSPSLSRELARAGKQQLLLLPNDKVQLLTTRLPALKGKEIRRALMGLIHKQRGPGDSGWVFDFRQRPERNETDLRDAREVYGVLFVERSTIEEFRGALAARSLRPRLALPPALALEALLRRESPQDEEEGAWSLVHLGHEEHFLIVGDGRDPIFFRELPRDLSGGSDQQEYLSRLVTEIERSNFFAQQGEQPARVNRLFLAGNPELVAPLLPLLEKMEGLRVAHWRPEERFALDGEPAPWDLLLPLAGAAAVFLPRTFNLMQQREEDRAVRKLRSYAMLAGVSLLIAILPLLASGGILTKLQQQRVIDTQSRQLEHTRRAAEESARSYLYSRALLTRQELVNDAAESRMNFGGLLRDVAGRVPGSMRLLNLSLERNGPSDYRVILDGECVGAGSDKTQWEFLKLREALAESPFLAGGAEPSYLEISEGESDNDSRVTFSLEYEVRREGDG